MDLLELLHQKMVYNHRMDAISQLISSSLTEGDKVLDIGSGDGKIASLVMQQMPSVNIEGIDLFVRKETFIKVTEFDGITIPFSDNFFNSSLLIDVLHHTDCQADLLIEAARVTRDFIIIKDHIKGGLLSETVLKIMDYTGNASHGVRLPYNYLTKDEWEELFEQTGLTSTFYKKKLKLYPFPLNLFFDRNLHFFVKLNSLTTI